MFKAKSKYSYAKNERRIKRETCKEKESVDQQI